MKITTRSSKKYLIISGLVLLILMGATLFVFHQMGVIDIFESKNQSSPTPHQKSEQRKTDAQQKSTYLNSTKTGKGSTDDSHTQPAPVPTDSSTIQLTATQQGSSVVVTTQLNGQGYSSGSCKLTVSRGGSATSQTANIIYQPEYSTCAGFSIPVSSVGAGSWNIALEVTPLNGSTLTKSTSLTVSQ